jgi:hypothetical protein
MTRLFFLAILVFACPTTGCASDRSTLEGAKEPGQQLAMDAASSPPSEPAPAGSSTMANPQSIGTATMSPDGTIVLQLRAEGPGVRGEGRIVYPPTHKDYADVLKHLGGLKPGETKPVAPWPD